MARLRILIVEDSVMVRRRLADVFADDPSFTVVGEAGDGERGFELCQRLRPDVVTLDLMLPGINGVEVTKRIMAHCPTPIVIFSGVENRTMGLHLLDALSAGAVDAVEKPTRFATEEWTGELLTRVKLAARPPTVPPTPTKAITEAAMRPRAARMVAIGASTGGPAAVKDILQRLPPDFPLPMLLVMHLSEKFEASMVDWLGKSSTIPVRHAVDGEPIPPSGRPVLLMARANKHLVLREGRLRLVDGPERHSSRPSVDVLFESVAKELGPRAIGCLLTGMGKDGAEGLGAMQRAGAMTLAQDEASSVVFGMPREAIRLGAVRHVLALKDIPAWLDGFARQRIETGHA
ncbi:chemotaxis-specific protein-glutamate methyltransferase CheB [Hyalangium rubrum]|uniref:Protein-glutamate methylesterase/protein-glutamine glutaminase n=1 Tax=Hyalangium rubrum TaxID=3103134 RepID=A0ABU5H9Z6_9BACT|nr:chemotaxis-specific protein-glutamate methyltransferase CheB [Hyalangium sp. s54d21]MDY7230299.1 chemotaxis-specific protein-glutamate methyltransferase CheB [Hyalangium sp. s54d21]